MTNIAVKLAAEREIDSHIDNIVRAVAKRVAALGDVPQLEESQLNNLVNVADHTTSQEAVTNFIRYQIGRDRNGDKWACRGFGAEVIKDIEKEDRVIQTALKAVVAKVPLSNENNVVRARLIALYTGYLTRTYVYAKSRAEYARELSDRVDVLDKPREATANV